MNGIKRRRSLLGLVLVGAMALTACGSSGGKASQGSTGSSSGAASSAGADLAGARSTVAAYEGKPSAFPVDVALPRALPKGTKFGYLQCVTPVCGLFGSFFGEASTAIGGQLQTAKAGGSSDALQSAFGSLLEARPAGILIPGIEPTSVSQQLATAASAKLPMASNGIMDAEKYGIGGQTLGRPTAELAGKLLAAWVVDRKGARAKPVLYSAPELSFTAVVQQAFTNEMKQLCAKCQVRFKQVPVTAIGTSAPNLIVSDLQANPGSNVAVFDPQELSTGLPAALGTAGLKIDTVGFAPVPANLQDIKNGKITAGLGLDLAVAGWTMVDEVARLIMKAPLTNGEKTTIPPMQFLSAKDLTSDVSKGWTGYPDFPQRFSKLWLQG